MPLLLSLVDTAIDRNQPMGSNWPVDKLRQVRRALRYMVFALLDYKLRRLSHNYYAESGRTYKMLDPVGRRYRSIFGPHIDWRTDGFEGLIAGFAGGTSTPATSP